MAVTDVCVRPLRRVEYDQLVEAGAFEGERIELFAGRLLRMSPQGVRHSLAVERLTELFVTALAGRARVRVQLPFLLDQESEPEPDLAIIARDAGTREHPRAALLIVEVAESSLDYGRRDKAVAYARAGVAEYWLVDLVGDAVEVRRQPQGEDYRRIERCVAGAAIAPLAFPDLELAVADLLPPRG